MTYGDGVADINLKKLEEHHLKKGKLATLTAVIPPGRYGALTIKDDTVIKFDEKVGDGGLVNGGFFVLSPKCISYIHDDFTIWENDPLQNLAKENQLNSFS